MPNKPNVFLSHASEDKDRFVREFAEKLIQNGINVWYDEWELLPGDSLVEKIFEEGISECDYFIVVLSENSLEKKWVKEELHSGVVSKIEGNCTIIPIIIDENISVPQSLKHTVWSTIENTHDYPNELQRILSTIHGESQKPDIGDAPKFSLVEPFAEDFTSIDSTVLKISGNLILSRDDLGRMIGVNDVVEKSKKYDLKQKQVIDSLEFLESKLILEIYRVMGGMINSHIQLSHYGFVLFAEGFVGNYQKKLKDIVSLIINENFTNNYEIAKQIECEQVLVHALLLYFEDNGWIRLQKAIGGNQNIYDITGAGKRKLKSIIS